MCVCHCHCYSILCSGCALDCFSFLDNNDDEEERRTRGDVCVCVVMQRDWETRESGKRETTNTMMRLDFFVIIFLGAIHSNERLTLSLFYTQQTTFDYQYNNNCILLYTYLYQPFLNYWKISKSYTSYMIFFISFTLCRIVWVPYFIYTTYAIHLHGQIDILIWPSLVFYALQLAWFAKMW